MVATIIIISNFIIGLLLMMQSLDKTDMVPAYGAHSL